MSRSDANLDRQRAALEGIGLGSDLLIDVAPAVVGVAEPVPLPPIPEARSFNDVSHRGRTNMPTNYVLRRAEVEKMTDAQWGLVYHLFVEVCGAQRRYEWREIVDMLRTLIFTGGKWSQVTQAPRLRLRKSDPALWVALEASVPTFPPEHADFGEEMRILSIWARRYLARLRTRKPTQERPNARLANKLLSCDD